MTSKTLATSVITLTGFKGKGAFEWIGKEIKNGEELKINIC